MHSPSPYRSIRRRCLAIAVSLLAVAAVSAPVLTSCTEPLTYTGSKDDPYKNFDMLARTVRERYCFFSQKDIDWDAVTAKSRAQLTPQTNPVELFRIMSGMLDSLHDGHVNLNAPFATSYYKKWWSDYPQDFDNRTLQEYYLKFGGYQKNGLTYCAFLPDTVGYVRIPSFSVQIPPATLDYVLAAMDGTVGLIIDIRDNGGGYLTNVPEVVGRFITKKITGGYIRHKTGPGPEDFSKPYRIEYEPAAKGRIQYLGLPVILLTNRSCFSAANDFTAVMKSLPNVTVVGARTGGGGGMPFSSELPNGWGIRFSASPINDSEDRITEFGIDPDIEVHCTPDELAAGKDAILDYALGLFHKE